MAGMFDALKGKGKKKKESKKKVRTDGFRLLGSGGAGKTAKSIKDRKRLLDEI